ncbi:MAG: LD-carboxypeptidase [Rickettsiales bacterium]|jgi:hypothetical protein|nr:LD-carboxypeptidase [Rickettsiales bacterium]
MEYLKNLLDGIRTTLDNIWGTINTTKETIVVIANAISTVSQILGFIGLRVFILLLMTTLFIWILNLSSPLTKKINYFISVTIVTYIAWNANLPLQIVIFKYILIILSPLLIATIVNLSLRIYKTFYRTTNKKINNYIIKKSFFSKSIKFPFIPSISVLFSSGLPTKEELNDIPDKIMESEKILLTNNVGRIVFLNENKASQFIKSCADKEINLMWFWNGHYGANEVVRLLEKTEKIKQTKYVVGNGDNSFILNFLQDKWGWKVIYSNNYINRIEIDEKKEYSLKLINDFPINDGWLIKKRIVASDISVYAIEPISCDRKILYLGGFIENEVYLYRYLLNTQNYILKTKQRPESIILDINIDADIVKIIFDFNDTFKKHFMYMPIFYGNIESIISNEKCVIGYKENNFFLKQ